MTVHNESPKEGQTKNADYNFSAQENSNIFMNMAEVFTQSDEFEPHMMGNMLEMYDQILKGGSDA